MSKAYPLVYVRMRQKNNTVSITVKRKARKATRYYTSAMSDAAFFGFDRALSRIG